jgi:Icc-related predicted phosphoesterase
MKILMVGDTHGDTRSLIQSLSVAGNQGIQHVLVLGDFGLWTHFADGVRFLDDINEYAAAMNLTIYAIGGNHENWDHWNWFVENMPKGGKGWAMVRSRVALAPRIHTWKWDNTKFLGVGGAVSIDKDSRLHMEKFGTGSKGGSGPRTLYWPNEQLTDEDVERIEKIDTEKGFHPDVLVTHDCSNYTPFRERLKPDLDSQIHRQRIDRVLKHTRPDFHFHGHMHTKYDWLNTNVYQWEHGTQTYGLECNGMWDNYGIFDTETKTFTWRGDIVRKSKGSPLSVEA